MLIHDVLIYLITYSSCWLRSSSDAVHPEGRGAAPGPHNAEAEAARSEWLQYEAVLSSARDMRTMEGRVAQRAADRLTSLANELALGSRAAEMAVQVCALCRQTAICPFLSVGSVCCHCMSSSLPQHLHLS